MRRRLQKRLKALWMGLLQTAAALQSRLQRRPKRQQGPLWMKGHLQQPQSVHHLQQQAHCRLLLQILSPCRFSRPPRGRGIS